MTASGFEFRYRYAIHVVVFSACFIAPWDVAWMQGTRPSLWSAASFELSRVGVAGFGSVSIALAIVGMVLAFAGAWLRTWGSAHLGAGVVEDGTMQGGGIVADGPYRHMRNPLYVGTWLHTLALSLVMSPIGGVAAMVLIGVFQLRLIGAEEAFLSKTLGAPYADYCARVPRLWPSLRPRYPASGEAARWLPSLLSESYFWLYAVSFTVLAWRYDTLLLHRAVVISVGVWLVLRALLPPAQKGRALQA